MKMFSSISILGDVMVGMADTAKSLIPVTIRRFKVDWTVLFKKKAGFRPKWFMAVTKPVIHRLQKITEKITESEVTADGVEYDKNNVFLEH